MSIIDEAMMYAIKAHEGQNRKLTNLPYILHPMEVANIISTVTKDYEVIAAGILHDTVEDCGVKPEEITEKFGDRVAKLVAGETENKHSNRPPEETWKQRKEESLKVLKETDDINIKILWIADKVSNLRSYYREHEKNGDECFRCLHQPDPKMHKWYYEKIAEYTAELKETFAYREYIELMNKIFG